MSALNDPRRALLDAVWRERMHVDPRAGGATATVWEPALRLRDRLAVLPAGLLEYWLACGRGHIVVGPGPSAYSPGEREWRGQVLDGVCAVSDRDVLGAPGTALAAVGDMLDHLLGSRGEADGAWFADGVGATPALADAARRLARIQALGYGAELGGADSPRACFRATWALYLTDARHLNSLDPLVHRLYRHTLFAERFWRQGHGTGA